MRHTMKKSFRALKLSSLVVMSLLSSHAMGAQCDYAVSNDWGSGFTASITITNDGTTPIHGWQVGWSYTTETSITNIWQATLTQSAPFTATDLGWNGTIEPGKSVSFGFQGEGSSANGAIVRCLNETPDPDTGTGNDETDTGDPDSGNGSDTGSDSGSGSGDTSEPDGTLSSVALTKLMGTGWNAGNTLDAVGGETNWGNPKLTQKLFDAVKAAGFKSVRIPVAWSQFSDEKNYTIKDSWMNRVDEVVNYALNADLYVMINMHWDGGWMQPTYAKQDDVTDRMTKMWTQIATHFKDYNHHLLFAGTNEVMVDGDYGTPTVEYYTVQNGFNQTFVNTVRATGGKNADRFLVVQGFNTNIDHTYNFVQIPTDTATDRLLMEVHFYDPYQFTLDENSSVSQWGNIATDSSKTAGWGNESFVDSQFAKMKSKFVDQGIGVILGEFGVISRLSVSDHEQYRVYWNKYVAESAIAHGMVPVYWDNGYAGDHGMAIFDRNSAAQINPEIIQAVVGADTRASRAQ